MIPTPTTRVLTGQDLTNALDAVAQLRITVFSDWPYLYDGDLDYERNYLRTYETSKNAILVGAFDGDTLVGASTGTPLVDHADDFAAAFTGTGIDLARTFYCAESVLLPQYRGKGIGKAFFRHRETHARELGAEQCCFCSVVRPEDHPHRPAGYRPLDTFWQSLGYRILPGVIAQFSWKDHRDVAETQKPLQFWIKNLI